MKIPSGFCGSNPVTNSAVQDLFYPPVFPNIAGCKIPIFNREIHLQVWFIFQSAMLVYQRIMIYEGNPMKNSWNPPGIFQCFGAQLSVNNNWTRPKKHPKLPKELILKVITRLTSKFSEVGGTLQGTITYPTLGKGKSSTQKCRLGGDILVSRRVFLEQDRLTYQELPNFFRTVCNL